MCSVALRNRGKKKQEMEGRVTGVCVCVCLWECVCVCVCVCGIIWMDEAYGVCGADGLRDSQDLKYDSFLSL